MKVIPKVGQVWVGINCDTSLIEVTMVNKNEVVYCKCIRVSLDKFYAMYKFRPSNDLEWLAKEKERTGNTAASYNPLLIT